MSPIWPLVLQRLVNLLARLYSRKPLGGGGCCVPSSQKQHASSFWEVKGFDFPSQRVISGSRALLPAGSCHTCPPNCLVPQGGGLLLCILSGQPPCREHTGRGRKGSLPLWGVLPSQIVGRQQDMAGCRTWPAVFL